MKKLALVLALTVILAGCGSDPQMTYQTPQTPPAATTHETVLKVEQGVVTCGQRVHLIWTITTDRATYQADRDSRPAVGDEIEVTLDASGDVATVADGDLTFTWATGSGWC